MQCPKCDFTFNPETAPGGHCPRCLLLGPLEEEFEPEPMGLEGGGREADLPEDELAAELLDFELVECLGRGGMGIVWKARERLLDRHVAIKLLRNENKDPTFMERFTREARVMARLNHPNIVTLYSFGRTRSGHCYLVMELVRGTNLANLIAKGPLGVNESLLVVGEICNALEHAHEAGFVHRDIKPANILLNQNGRVKVADFGLARITGRLDTATLSITRQGWTLGTPHYIAPEQEYGKGVIDHRADIYSLGIMFYQMLTGELPRGVFTLPSSKTRADARLDEIVLRAMQDQPDKRYQNVGELSAQIRQYLHDTDPSEVARRAAVRKTVIRRRLEMVVATLAALLVGLISAWYAHEWLDPIANTSRPMAPRARELPVPDEK